MTSPPPPPEQPLPDAVPPPPGSLPVVVTPGPPPPPALPGSGVTPATGWQAPGGPAPVAPGTTYSPDGRFVWNGQSWAPAGYATGPRRHFWPWVLGGGSCLVVGLVVIALLLLVFHVLGGAANSLNGASGNQFGNIVNQSGG